MSRIIKGLLVSTNEWRAPEFVEMRASDVFGGVRAHIGCRTVEVIYPFDYDKVEFPNGEEAVVIGLGDEEGRLVDSPKVNTRVTKLFNRWGSRDWWIYGDVVLVTDRPDGTFGGFESVWLESLRA